MEAPLIAFYFSNEISKKLTFLSLVCLFPLCASYFSFLIRKGGETVTFRGVRILAYLRRRFGTVLAWGLRTPVDD